MADVAESSSAPKPVVVRVKRKLSQAPLDAFWLEINDRPLKRAFLDFEHLSVSESGRTVDLKSTKFLVHRVETVVNPEATKDVLQSLAEPTSSNRKNLKQKIEERMHAFKQANEKQDLLRSTAREVHAEHAKAARFKQIWKSRNSDKEAMNEEFVKEFCHLYDVVRIDGAEEETSDQLKTDKTSPLDEDDAILCNYLPLIRQYLPDAATQIEVDIKAKLSNQDGYVYDLYTVDNAYSTSAEDMIAYPSVHVDAEDDYYDGPEHSDFETDDSNAEDNPLNDYPDEMSSEGADLESRSSGSEEEGDTEAENSTDHEDLSEEEEYWKWAHR